MLWESLVSDGHVRSARLRRLQPWVLAAGLLLIWLGAWVASLAPGTRHETSVLAILQQRIAKVQTRADAAMAALPRPALTPADLAALPPFAEVDEVIQATLQSLDKSGDLPSDTFDFVETDREALWKGEWRSEKLHYLRSGDLIVVAAHVNVGNAARAQPSRWMGAFRKFGDKWQYCSLAGPGLYLPRQHQTVRPRDLPLSLSPVLPDER